MGRIGRIAFLLLAVFYAVWTPATEPPTAPAPPHDGWLLRFNLKAGDVYRYATTAKQDTLMELGPMGRQTATSTSRYEMSFKVKDRLPDGGALIEFAYERIVIDGSGGPNPVHFDSAEAPGDGAADPMAMLGGMIGKRLSVKTGARGEITQVEGFEAVWQELERRLPASPAGRQVKQMLRASFGPETIKATMQQVSMIYPAGPVRAQDSWDHALSLPHPLLGELQLQTTYRVEGPETRDGQPCVKLSVASLIGGGGNGPMLEHLGQVLRQANPEAKVGFAMAPSLAKGLVWVDQASGLMRAAESRQILEATIAVVMGEDQSMQMKMIVDQTTTMELQRDQARP